MTSFDVIRKLKKIYNTQKIGHTGTLDPMATGLLCVLIGPCVKLSDYLMNGDKTYYAGLKLGIKTDTQDVTGTIINKSDTILNDDVVKEIILSFVGEYSQMPPMYSAKKIDGKKLYDYARAGETIERKPSSLYISSIVIDDKNCKFPDYYFTVNCSKGTYIRTLCDDIGEKTGIYGTMSSLKRTKCSSFLLENAYAISDLENMTDEEKEKALLKPNEIFPSYPKVRFSEFYTKLSLNGCEIYQNKIGTSYAENSYIFVYSFENKLLGLGKVEKYDGGLAIKLKVRL